MNESIDYEPPQDPASQSNYLKIKIIHSHLDWKIDWEEKIISGSVYHTLRSRSRALDEILLDSSELKFFKIFKVNQKNEKNDDEEDEERKEDCLEEEEEEEEVKGFKSFEIFDENQLESKGSLEELKFEVGKKHPVLGSVLKIRLNERLSLDEKVVIRIDYSTSKDLCTALGWLNPSQTASKNHPFLYSQCQAIHARSLLPVQDTPSVKFTYTALAKSYLPVLFSARRIVSTKDDEKEEEEEEGFDSIIRKGHIREFRFEQPIKIPSYLIAIAAGELVYKKMSERTGVWSDPLTIDQSFEEFSSSTEKFLSSAEEILGVPYDWLRYDVLVLPPSFPYGGMENSNLTFLTPSLLTGDKSLVDVVAHEISHSWFGNNVGCANWGSFWLNEGWTTYLERLILRNLHGDQERSFSYIIGRKALADDLKGFEDQPRFQQLEIQYEFGEDPDQAFSNVPYDKGSNFLLYLEGVVGGLEIFLNYAKDYVLSFRGKSLDTKIWKDHLFKFFNDHRDRFGGVVEKLDEVDWEGWLHGRGLELPVQPKYDTSLADAAYELAERWKRAQSDFKLRNFKEDDIKGFNSNQIVVFLETLDSQVNLKKDLIDLMDLTYKFDKTGNQEIRLRWYLNCLKPFSEDDGSEVDEKYCISAAEWVKDKGRMKFARPVYRALFKVDPELALKTFKENIDFYHPICRNLIAKDLGL